MNSLKIYSNARDTLLKMFRDRNYEGPYEEAKSVDLKAGEVELSSEGTLNENIDLSGFVETRLVRDDTGDLVSIKIPVYAHFSAVKKGVRNGGLKKEKLFSALRDRYSSDIYQPMSEVLPEKYRIDYKSDTEDEWMGKVMDDYVMYGVHVIIIYDAWDISHNKQTKEMQFFSVSNETSPHLYDIEVLPLHTLIVDVTQHTLVPRHILLNYEQKKKFLDHMKTVYLNVEDKEKVSQMSERDVYRFMENYVFKIMPKINLHDPVNIHYHGRLKDIYMIIRNGSEVSYRMVKKSPLVQDQGK